ncbi:hypothetical protein BGX29_005371 [Mortierella sp. GBA35]|nr:hypothetical protein BGX29_005371 [Mortierella sp. GBA35]
MCPAPSTATFFNNTSIPSLATRCFTPPSSSCCLSGVSLEKRRWSNDSTRGLYGSAESTTSSGTLAFLAAAGDEVTSGPRPSTSTTSSYEGGSSMVNEYSGELEVRKREKKKTKKAKKACPGLSLFSFMLKK